MLSIDKSFICAILIVRDKLTEESAMSDRLRRSLTEEALADLEAQEQAEYDQVIHSQVIQELRHELDLDLDE